MTPHRGARQRENSLVPSRSGAVSSPLNLSLGGHGMNRRRCTLVTAILVLASYLWLAGCAPGNKAPQAILVGATLAETGPLATGVGPVRKLMHAWAEMVNAHGGLYLKDYGKKLPIRFVIYDDGSNREKSERLYEKLIKEDKVHLLLGPYSSPITMGATMIAERHRVPMICVEANSNAIYSRGFKWIVGVLDTGHKWAYSYLDLLQAKTDARTIAFVVQGNLHAKEVYEGAVVKAKELGLQVTAGEIVPPDVTDFGPIIAKLKQIDPDIVFLSSVGIASFTVGFVRQAKAMGLNPKGLHVTQHGGYFLQALQGDAELITGENYWIPGIAGEGTDEFKALLEGSGLSVEEYPWTAIRMSAFQVLRAGLEQAGSLEPDKFMTALKNLDIHTLTGRLTFASNGAGTMNPIPTQIQHGQYVSIWPQEIARGAYLYPRAQYFSRREGENR